MPWWVSSIIALICYIVGLLYGAHNQKVSMMKADELYVKEHHKGYLLIDRGSEDGLGIYAQYSEDPHHFKDNDIIIMTVMQVPTTYEMKNDSQQNQGS